MTGSDSLREVESSVTAELLLTVSRNTGTHQHSRKPVEDLLKALKGKNCFPQGALNL